MKILGRRSVASFLSTLLTVVSVGVAIGMILAAGLAVIPLFTGVGEGWVMDVPVAFTVESRAVRSDPSAGIDNAEIQAIDARGSLKFRPPSGSFLASTALILFSFLAVFSWVLSQLRGVFRTLRDGQPFVAANVTRLRRIGYAVMAGEFVRAGLHFVSHRYVMTHFAADGLRFEAALDLNPTTIIYGLVILVIAEVFELGTRLDHDQSLTI